MTLTQKLAQHEFESIAKELVTVLVSKGVSFKEAEEIMGIVHGSIYNFKREPIKNRDNELLSGILEWLSPPVQ